MSDYFWTVPRYPDLKTHSVFNTIPRVSANLPARVDFEERYSFRSFLKRVPSLDLWEFGIDGTVVNFSNIGGCVFLSMGKILVHYCQSGKFTGDLMGRIQIRNDLTVSYTSPLIEENDSVSSKHGLETDILHFRHMIAQVILKSLGQDFEQKLSATFKLFFSELFLYDKDLYVLQYCHPIFFNPSERLSFIHLILDYTNENPGSSWIGYHFEGEKFSFHNWKQRVPADCICVYQFNPSDAYEDPFSLSRFIRNCGFHFRQHPGILHPTAEEINEQLHQAYPGVCELFLDGYIRAVEGFFRIEKFPFGWNHTFDLGDPERIHRPLADLLFKRPYAFTILSYSYHGVQP